MEKDAELNFAMFKLKLAIIRTFYNEYHLSFYEIAIIVDSRPEVIKLYCKRLLH